MTKSDLEQTVGLYEALKEHTDIDKLIYKTIELIVAAIELGGDVSEIFITNAMEIYGAIERALTPEKP
jgi:hypothetical protein